MMEGARRSTGGTVSCDVTWAPEKGRTKAGAD